jgi:hypothetical protein
MREDNPLGGLVDVHQTRLLGGCEIVDLALACCPSQQAEVSRALQHGEHQQVADGCGQGGDAP